jgi:hypothetical protein
VASYPVGASNVAERHRKIARHGVSGTLQSSSLRPGKDGGLGIMYRHVPKPTKKLVVHPAVIL